MTDHAGADVGAPPSGDPLTLDISLSVLDDLGTNLYSSIPAVLSEAVANAWDADASEVRIDIAREKITVRDDGAGMSRKDMQDKYLTVGYRRRESDAARTAGDRPVMGRKGIGKLSLFAIAETVEVVTRQEAAAAVGVKLHAPDIRESARARVPYHPEEFEPPADTTPGTAITISDLRVDPNALTERALRKRLARRFSVIDSAFRVWVQGAEVTIENRDDLPGLQYVWIAGDPTPDPRDLATRAERKFELPPLETDGHANAVHGWLGTFPDQKAVNPNEGDNQVAVLARGKVIHEDILPDVKAAGYSAKYLIGRLEANFLDEDDKADIATSDRQSVKETDPRFTKLLEWFQHAVHQVANDWSNERSNNSLQNAMDEFHAIREWHDTLSEDAKRFAKQLFGKIGSLNKANEDTKCELYRNSIIAFERLRLREQMNRIDDLPDDPDFSVLTALFRGVDEIEKVDYHKMLQGRLSVVQRFQGLVDTNKRERVLQEYLFDHLWLLDPSWERAAKNLAFMERTVQSALGKVVEGLSEEERRSRIDIGYRTHAGKHVIIELKRASAQVDIHDLSRQLSKYRDALKKAILASEGSEAGDPEIEVVAVLGSDPVGNPSERTDQVALLRVIDARWITYDSLFVHAENVYREYIEAHTQASKLNDLIQQIKPAGRHKRLPAKVP